MNSNAGQGGYDQVGIKMPGGGYNLISREEFEKKAINERVQLILNGQAQFIRRGVVVPTAEALSSQNSSPNPK